MRIGPHNIDPPLILAPMAGVTDKPFRQLCKRLGAGYAVSEMTSSDPRLWRTRKSVNRLDHEGEPTPIGVQIAGADAQALAGAARHAVQHGAGQRTARDHVVQLRKVPFHRGIHQPLAHVLSPQRR